MMSTDGAAADFARLARSSAAAPLTHALAVMLGADFLPLPVHARGALVVNLHAIHADIALAGFRVAGDHARQGDEASGILRPALQDGKVVQRKLSCRMTSLQGPVATVLGKNLPISASMGSIFTLSRKPCGDFTSMKARMRSAIRRERRLRAPGSCGVGAELVDENLRSGMAFDVLEEERGAA